MLPAHVAVQWLAAASIVMLLIVLGLYEPPIGSWRDFTFEVEWSKWRK
jgi:hypothetical protein